MHRHFTRDDRVALATLLKTKLSQAECARRIDFDPSSISREIARVGTRDEYRVYIANLDAKKRRKGSKVKYRIDNNKRLRRFILRWLKKHWSPEQIAGRWNLLHADNLFHQTIYNWIYDEHRELTKLLPRQGRKRRKYGEALKKNRYEASKRSIHEREELVESRVRLGDWEGDTIVGKERTQRILTHVDRSSLYLIADKLDRVTCDDVHKKTRARMKSVPCKTITYDNGSEFTLHKMIERDTKAEVYFADVGRPDQRGTNENTNGLLRRFFPKGSSFANITQEDVDRAVDFINNRPRKSLGFLTSREVFTTKPIVAFQERI